MNRSFQISSNNGWDTIDGELKSSFEKSSVLLVVEIKISSRNWNRSKVLKGEEFELQDDASITLKQVIISREKLVSLNANLIKWAAEPFTFKSDLTGDPSQPVNLEIGVRENQICSLEKPVFTFKAAISHGHLESFFVVDQSCLRIFQEGITELLEAVNQQPVA